ncbi:MAG: hypothetical protein Q8S21_02410 [Candidatus Paracaedibacteraceae bacterium]|nr:hypothetical protein [Candidatus Paracaedibacteraceae bacterium]
MTKLGKGEFALTYNEANTFMGGTEIQDGTVSVSNSDSLSTGLVKFDSTNGTPALKTLACVDIQNTIDISDCTAILIATAPTTLSGLLSTTTASILNVTGGQEANFIGDQSTAFKVVVSGEATRVPIGDNFKEGTTFTYGEGTIISSHVHYIPYQIFIG